MMELKAKLCATDQENIYLLSPKDLVYCKADNGYTILYLTNGKELVLCKSLTRFFNELDEGQFIRISQSYIINTGFISIINKKSRTIELVNQKRVPFTCTIKKLLSLLKIKADDLNVEEISTT